MSYDAPGVPLDFSGWTHDFPERFLGRWVPVAFDFGLLAAVPFAIAVSPARWVLVFICGCARIIDRRGDFHEYPHAYVHTHFIDR